MSKNCSHLASIKPVKPKTEGCEECLRSGDEWVSLRLCLSCGHVGCCNSSKNKHAQKHFETTKHPIIQNYGSDDKWKWCYIDKMFIGKHPNPLKTISKIIKSRLNGRRTNR